MSGEADDTFDLGEAYEAAGFDPDEHEWDEEDELELAIQECGIIPDDGGCQLAGTEYCDFECPFRDHPEWLTGEGDDEDGT
jgi:hypothetical protein